MLLGFAFLVLFVLKNSVHRHFPRVCTEFRVFVCKDTQEVCNCAWVFCTVVVITPTSVVVASSFGFASTAKRWTLHQSEDTHHNVCRVLTAFVRTVLFCRRNGKGHPCPHCVRTRCPILRHSRNDLTAFDRNDCFLRGDSVPTPLVF